MAHPIHKIVGPMLRRNPPATVQEVHDALINPIGECNAPWMVCDEWINEARRRNGLRSTSAEIGMKWRIDRDLRRHMRERYAPRPPAKKKSWLQRLARRITRIFRK